MGSVWERVESLGGTPRPLSLLEYVAISLGWPGLGLGVAFLAPIQAETTLSPAGSRVTPAVLRRSPGNPGIRESWFCECASSGGGNIPTGENTSPSWPLPSSPPLRAIPPQDRGPGLGPPTYVAPPALAWAALPPPPVLPRSQLSAAGGRVAGGPVRSQVCALQRYHPQLLRAAGLEAGEGRRPAALGTSAGGMEHGDLSSLRA